MCVLRAGSSLSLSRSLALALALSLALSRSLSLSRSLARALSLSLYNVYVDITRRLLSRFFSRRVFKRRIAS